VIRARPTSSRAKRQLSQLVFWMLAATDGHAKNFSISHHRGGRFGLTTLYDALSAWPVVGKRGDQLDNHELKLAMALPGTRRSTRAAQIAFLEVLTVCLW
jgi:serine/threonine-protein kinase HipA